MRPGFKSKRVRYDLLSENPEDWRAYVEVVAPSVIKFDEMVSLGDNYFIIFGAHAHNTILLMDKLSSETLTVQRCLECCALFSFATDSAVVPLPRDVSSDATDSSSFSQSLRGTAFRDLDGYREALCSFVESISSQNEQTGFDRATHVERKFGRKRLRVGNWWYYPWPPTQRLFRAMSAYSLALLSVLAPSRLLNFWRALEAVTNKVDREHLFANLDIQRIAPVWSEATEIPIPRHLPRMVDFARLLRRSALLRRDSLIAEYGSASAALDNLYWQGRGKAAHADKVSLEYDMAIFVGDQLRDAELLRFMARAAIERAWQEDEIE